MARKNHTTNLTELLLQCMAQPDPMLSMLERLCSELMEAEVSQQLEAEKRALRQPKRISLQLSFPTVGYTDGHRVPHDTQGRHVGYIPFFVTERKRSEAALIQVVQDAFVQGVSTRRRERLARSLGIENLSRSQVSEMTKGLNAQVDSFRNRSLSEPPVPYFMGRCAVRKGARRRKDCEYCSHGRLWCGRARPERYFGYRTYAGRVRGRLSAPVSQPAGTRSSHTPTGDLRCTFRSCGGNSQGGSRRKLAEV